MTRTWPADWEERKAGRDCPMCEEGRPDRTSFGTRILAGRYADAYLQRRGQRGYVVVIWRGRHVSEPTELSAEESSGYWLEVLAVGRALDARYRPAKLNYLALGNAVPHLHTHVVPRYVDDPAPGRPLDPGHEVAPIPDADFAADVSALHDLLRQ